MTSRDDFVAELIDELKKQQLSGALFTEVPKKTFMDVIKHLSYDIPEITGEELKTLADGIARAVKTDTAFPMSRKLLENLTFLTAHAKATTEKHEKADNKGGYTTEEIAEVSAVLFSLVPLWLLTCPPKRAQGVYFDRLRRAISSCSAHLIPIVQPF